MRAYKMKAENVLLNYSLRKKCVNRRLNKLCSNTRGFQQCTALFSSRSRARTLTHARTTEGCQLGCGESPAL